LKELYSLEKGNDDLLRTQH